MASLELYVRSVAGSAVTALENVENLDAAMDFICKCSRSNAVLGVSDGLSNPFLRETNQRLSSASIDGHNLFESIDCVFGN